MLKQLVRKYPLINIEISPIDRQITLDKIQLVGDELEKPVFLWSLLQSDFQPLSAVVLPSWQNEPTTAILKAIASLQATTSGLYVFENLFATLEAIPALAREACYQAFTQLFTRLNQPSRECLVVFIESGMGRVPSFLRQIIQEYKFPLPTDFELSTLLFEHGINLSDAPRLRNILAGLTTEEIRLGLRANQDITDLDLLGDELLKYKYNLFAAFGLEFIGDTSTKDVGGLDLVKAAMQEVKLDFSPAARACGLPLPRGMIMVGIPGSGKTYFAKTCANILGFPLINIGIDVVKSGGVANFKRLLNRIDACAPNIPYLDEFDKFFADEQGKELLGILLTWLNEKSSATYVMATLNRLENLPPELTRAGRFDRVFYVDFPGADERKQILQLHCARFDRRFAESALGPLSAEDWESIIEETDKYTGAELAQMAIVAAKSYFYTKLSKPARLQQIAVDETATADDLAEWSPPVLLQGDLKINKQLLIAARKKVKSLYSRNPEGVLAIENRAKAFTEASSSNKPSEFDLPPINIYAVQPFQHV
jgi:ATPase family associated with various cellular activities (AAA)